MCRMRPCTAMRFRWTMRRQSSRMPSMFIGIVPAGVVLGDKAANINKTLSSDNEDMSYGPRFEAPDEATPLDKKYNIRPGRKLINTGYRYMTGDSYNKAENDKWYTDLFAYYPFGSVEEPVAPGDSLARVMFVDAGGNRRIAGNSIDIGAHECPTVVLS